MRLVSVSVGQPREVEYDGDTVRTSIWKSPVAGPVRVTSLNLEGDRQSDLRYHGGKDKAVYAYPAEHYAYWRAELPGVALPPGAFGENFTTEGLTERDAKVGDHLQIGSAEFVVTQPRMPCYKLGVRFARADMVQRFLRSGRTGFYLAVVSEGTVSGGDAVQRGKSAADSLTIADVVGLYTEESPSTEMLARAIRLAWLPEDCRKKFRKKLAGSAADP
jgi:MOSC domain-containing protein YiiM